MFCDNIVIRMNTFADRLLWAGATSSLLARATVKLVWRATMLQISGLRRTTSVWHRLHRLVESTTQSSPSYYEIYKRKLFARSNQATNLVRFFKVIKPMLLNPPLSSLHQ